MATKAIIVVACEKGGVRKTATTLALIEFLERRDISVRAAQVDQQKRLLDSVGDAITVRLPSAQDIALDEHAEARAFGPLEDALLDNHAGAVVVDVGANCDERFARAGVRADWAAELEHARIPVGILVPTLLDLDSIALAGRTVRRMLVAFPKAVVTPVYSIPDVEYVAPTVAIAQALTEAFGDASTTPIIHPRIMTRTLGILENLRMTPRQFIDAATRDPRALASTTNVPRGAIVATRADLALVITTLDAGFSRVFPTFTEAVL